MPVVVIGGITALVFIGIIILSQAHPTQAPGMQEVSDEELISSHTPVKGPVDAPVTIVEFSDFQCPACKSFEPMVEQILNLYGDQVRLAYRHFPLNVHPLARPAAYASMAAMQQGKFWDYHDILFEKQPNFSNDELVGYAQQLGLNTEQFTQDMESSEIVEMVNEDVKTGTNLGINATPTFYLNGRKLDLRGFNDLRIEVEAELVKFSGDQQAPEDGGTQNQESGAEPQSGNETASQSPSVSLDAAAVQYTGEGFIPQRVNLNSGGIVTWTNATDSPITLTQTTDTYSEFADGITIQPGEEFDFRFDRSGQWNYEESGTGNFGTVYVQPLQDSQ